MMNSSIKNVKLYEFLKKEECHISKKDGEIVSYAFISLDKMSTLSKLIKNTAFNYGGFNVKFFPEYFEVLLDDILESGGDHAYQFKDCFPVNEFTNLEKELLEHYQYFKKQ